MKTKFAYPERRDLVFSRYSGFKQHEFAEEIRVMNSATDALLIIALLGFLLFIVSL